MSKGKDLINSIKYGLYRMLTKNHVQTEKILPCYHNRAGHKHLKIHKFSPYAYGQLAFL